MASKITPFHPIYTDIDGSPLDSGYIYIGGENLNPEIESKQVNVYWDAALTVPAAQPIRTINGYPSRDGSFAAMYVAESAISMTIRNKNGELVDTSLSEADATAGLRSDLISTDADKGFHLISYTILAGETGVTEPEYPPGDVRRYGAVVDGVTDDTAAITAMEANAFITEPYVPEGTCIVVGYILTKTYRGPGFMSVDGVVQPRNPDWDYTPTNGNRSIIRYYDANSIYITDKHFTMSEFRVMGQYTRLKAPTWNTTDDFTEVAIDTNTFGSQAKKLNNWYAAFACADQGDASVSTQAVPFLRVRSVASNVITLGQARLGDDELGGLLPAETYTWTPAELVGLQVLVISEDVLGGKTNILGSRVTTITAATTTTITLDDIGGIGARDWILPAPSGYDFFRYLGTFYVDSAEVTNLYDDGCMVRYLGVSNANFTNNYTGAILAPSTPVAIKVGGYISPLAGAVMIQSKWGYVAAGVGAMYERFGGDVSHLFHLELNYKEVAAQFYVRSNILPLPFLWRQEYAYQYDGALSTAKLYDEHYIYGWVEQ